MTRNHLEIFSKLHQHYLQVVEAVSDAAHSVAETITGEKPDLVLKHG